MRLTERSASHLEQTVQRGKAKYGRRLGAGPILEGCWDAITALRIDLSDAPSTPEVCVRMMRLLRPWGMGTSSGREAK